MACITLLSQPVAMATTQLTRAIGYQAPALAHQSTHQQEKDLQPLHMNWVVVTANDGSRKLSIQWATDGN